MDARATYLSTYKGFSGEPTISNISYGPQNFNLGDDVFINANITDVSDAFLVYRFGENMPFRKVTMFDDGNHNDGLANDGLYGVKIQNLLVIQLIITYMPKMILQVCFHLLGLLMSFIVLNLN